MTSTNKNRTSSIFFVVVLLTLHCVWTASAQNAVGPGLSLIWSKNVGGLKSFSLSSHGRRLALLTSDGKLAAWAAQDSTTIWASRKQGSSSVLVSDGAGLVLTYSAQSLLSTTATLRKADTGAVVWTKNFPAAIWSASFSVDGTSLAIGTGDNNVYVFDLASQEAQTTIPVGGTPVSLSFSADNSQLFVGMWDRSGLACYGLTGNLKWLDRGEMDRKYVVETVGARFITYIGSSIRHGRSPVVYVVRASSGESLWIYSLENDSFDASAHGVDAAESTGISYKVPRIIGSNAFIQQKLMAVDRKGQMLWEKGGLFWAPELICTTPDQSGLVVYDGKRKLYRLDLQGRTVATAVLSDDLRQWSLSSDDANLVVYTHDGQLSLLHIQ